MGVDVAVCEGELDEFLLQSGGVEDGVDAFEKGALLAVVGPRRLIVRRLPRSVELVNSRDLERFLAHRAQTLSGDQVAAISDVADLETTWSVSSASDLDAGRLHREFSIVRNEVGAALLRRVLWGVAAFALAYAVMVTMIATLVTSVVVRR